MNDNYKCVVVAARYHVMLDGRKGHITLGGLRDIEIMLTHVDMIRGEMILKTIDKQGAMIPTTGFFFKIPTQG